MVGAQCFKNTISSFIMFHIRVHKAALYIPVFEAFICLARTTQSSCVGCSRRVHRIVFWPSDRVVDRNILILFKSLTTGSEHTELCVQYETLE